MCLKNQDVQAMLTNLATDIQGMYERVGLKHPGLNKAIAVIPAANSPEILAILADQVEQAANHFSLILELRTPAATS